MKLRQQSINMSGQYGATTILLSLVILTLITFIALFTSKTVIMEQKIANNDTRSKIAFEAAEAGLEAGLAYTSSGYDHDSDDEASDELVFMNSGIVATGVGESSSKTFANGASVTVTISADASVSSAENFFISSVGTSDDGVATRTIATKMTKINPLATAPNTPFTARGGLTVGGNVSINNPEGFGTIVTGGSADLTGNATMTTSVADKTSSNYPACLGGAFACENTYAGCPDTTYVKCPIVAAAAKTATQGDVIDGETTLADMTGDEFFQATFGVTKSGFQNIADYNINGTDVQQTTPNGVSTMTNAIIWVEGDADLGNITVGCSVGVSGTRQTTSAQGYGSYDTMCDDAGGTVGPVLMVVNGNLTTGGLKFFGLLYVIGSITSTGNPDITGAVIVESGSGSYSGTGTGRVWYDSGVLRAVGNLGPTAATAGSWKDF